MDRRSASMTLAQLMTIVMVVSVLFAVAVPGLSRARRHAAKMDCWNNMCQLGTYMVMYVSKHGSDRRYPPAPGVGYFNALREVPTPRLSLAAGNDGLFVCPVAGTKESPTALDYREPAQQVSDGFTQPQWPIACDRPTNHDPCGADDINVLYFSGSVSREICAGSPEWNVAMQYTTDPR